MRSSLLGMWIKNSLTKEGKKKLMLQKAKFCYYYEGINTYEDDSVRLIRLIFNKCDPSTKSGINSLKSELSNFSLERYKQNELDILYAIQIYYNQILQNGGQDDNFILKVFNTLEMSDNENFLNFVKKKSDPQDEHELEDNADVLISTCTKKYNNLSKGKLGKKKSSKTSQDNQESKFMALLMQMVSLLSSTYATKEDNMSSKNCNKVDNDCNRYEDSNRN